MIPRRPGPSSRFAPTDASNPCVVLSLLLLSLLSHRTPSATHLAQATESWVSPLEAQVSSKLIRASSVAEEVRRSLHEDEGAKGRSLLLQTRGNGSSGADASSFIDAALFEPLLTPGQYRTDKAAQQYKSNQVASLSLRNRIGSRNKTLARLFPRIFPPKKKPTHPPPPPPPNPKTTTSGTPLSPDCPYTSAGDGSANLHKCAVGFAAAAGVTGGYGKTCGGLAPSVYVVTTNADSTTNPPVGSLRWAMLTCTSGVYVTFASSMTIYLKSALYVPKDTTIDGRGFQIVITNASMLVYQVSNVIIVNIEIGDIPGDTDVLHIRNSPRVWVDHVKAYNASRGTISVVYGSTDVTISNCYLYNGNFMNLLGASDDSFYDRNLRVTVYRNWYDRSGQRQPHCRWGTCHAANSLYTGWTYYCLGGRVYARTRSERNYFIADSRKTITPWFGSGALTTPGFDYTATIRVYGDRLDNGAVMYEFPGTMPPFNPPYSLNLMDPFSPNFKTFIMQNVGPKFPAAQALP
eukprot:TRINITY_DN17695_c0_g1_i1.p1 TRINITY_DN17695_c0_g1~~TRINITY_DN17695_c0_g1_i1.p1  ORF type:complete len:519 (+),score=-35.66 TRINITY_DN17695_c0_g1_i1:458-2014(+)